MKACTVYEKIAYKIKKHLKKFLTNAKKNIKIVCACEGGGIGRRVRLRGVWFIRVGSSPILHTNSLKLIQR